MKRNALLIRSTGDITRLGRLIPRLQESLLADVFIVLDKVSDKGRYLQGVLSSGVIELTSEFLEAEGLKYFPKCTWQCGDYFYYAAYRAVPEYDYYWLVDDDVVFNLNFDQFIEKSMRVDSDLFGVQIGRRRDGWNWYESMVHLYGKDQIFGMIYPLSRLSNRAVQFLFGKRTSYKSSVNEQDYRSFRAIPLHANDEAFTATTLVNGGFSSSSMEAIFKSEFAGLFSTRLPVFPEELDKPHTIGKVIHPVTDLDGARKKIEVLIKKRGAGELLQRMEEVIQYCGVDVWRRYCDLEPEVIREQAYAASKPDAAW